MSLPLYENDDMLIKENFKVDLKNNLLLSQPFRCIVSLNLSNVIYQVRKSVQVLCLSNIIFVGARPS